MALSKMQLSQLLSVYGETLSEIQRYAVTMYCDYDCSLSEIAAERGTTRQGVRDAIVKAEASLVKLEEALHLAEFCRNATIALNADDAEQLKELTKRFVSKE